MIWTLGDSHAGHLQGLLYSVYDKVGIGVHLIETPDVPFPMVSSNDFKPRDIIFGKILGKLREGDIVLLGRLFINRDGRNEPMGDPLRLRPLSTAGRRRWTGWIRPPSTNC